MSFFFTKKSKTIDENIYIEETIAIFSMVKPKSINTPNNAVPNAVENTINAVVKAFIEPICFTPYNSAQVDEPRTFANPLDIPIKPKNINAVNEVSKKIITNVESSNGIFIKINNFLLVNLSIRIPVINKVITDSNE